MFKIQSSKLEVETCFGFVWDWSETDASPDIWISNSGELD